MQKSIRIFDLRGSISEIDSIGSNERAKCFPFPTVLCIGNFDGVHLGHRALIDGTLDAVGTLKASYPDIVSGVWFFSPPSKAYFDLNSEHAFITTEEEKLKLFKRYGLDFAFAADFPHFRDMSPKDFINNTLTYECQCKEIVCGYNFGFGKNGSGNVQTIKEQFTGEAKIIDCTESDGMPISSTAIRKLIAGGDFEKANEFLGHNYSLTASVTSGRQIGRTIGFPTANIFFPDEKIIPDFGVYVTTVKIEGESKEYCGVTNVGSNPTISEQTATVCETHILGFDRDIYGKVITVEFLKKLRRERKFDSIDELKAQIAENSKQAYDYYTALKARIAAEHTSFKQ